MGKKGQISLDLILAIIITFIFASTMQTIIAGMNESQQEISVINQQKEIGNKILNVLNSEKTFSDSENFNVKYLVPNIIVLGDKESGCNIAITSSVISISSTFNEKNIGTVITHNANLSKLVNPNIKCGEYIEIKK